MVSHLGLWNLSEQTSLNIIHLFWHLYICFCLSAQILLDRPTIVPPQKHQAGFPAHQCCQFESCDLAKFPDVAVRLLRAQIRHFQELNWGGWGYSSAVAAAYSSLDILQLASSYSSYSPYSFYSQASTVRPLQASPYSPSTPAYRSHQPISLVSRAESRAGAT